MGNNFNTRIMGTRIKHQMGASSIKMYDKFGPVLRIETTTNDVSQFKCFRDVQHHDGSVDRIYKGQPLKREIRATVVISFHFQGLPPPSSFFKQMLIIG